MLDTIAIDIRESVFENETEAILYVTKDNEVEPSLYIFAIPVIAFSWCIEEGEEIKLEYDVFRNEDRLHKLVNEMKQAVKRFKFE